MAITVADQYYIKALSEYPFNLEESIENLQYALSHNQDHVGALYLMGCLYMEQLDEFDLAEEYFQAAIGVNPACFKVYCKYSLLMITIKNFKKAEKLIKYMYKIKGADLACVFQTEAFLCEHQKNFAKALMLLEKAKVVNVFD